MTRDRTSALRAVSKEAEFSNDSEHKNGEAAPFKPVLSVMETFFDLTEEIWSLINKISLKISEVKQTHSAILNSTESEDTERRKKELDDIMTTITATSRLVRSKLKEIESRIADDDGKNCANADIRIRKTQHATLSRRFIEVMTEYNNHQIEFRNQCKLRINRQMTITNTKVVTEDQIEDMLEAGDLNDFTQGILLQSHQTKQLLKDIVDRHEDIIRLEKSIRELHDMFVDISILVEQQGDMIDSIEYNISQTQNYVESAKQETHKAVTYRKSARKKKIAIIICVAVTVLVLVLILALAIGLR